MRQQSPQNHQHPEDYSASLRPFSMRPPQNYDIMWQTDYPLGTYSSVHGLSSQYYQAAVSYRYDDPWRDACGSETVATDRRPAQCENYDDQQWHRTTTGGTAGYARVRVSKRSRSYSRQPRRDDSSRYRWRHHCSKSTRRRSDVSRLSRERRQGRHSDSTLTSERYTRHRRRRRYSSSSSSSPNSRSTMVSPSHPTLALCSL